MKSSAETAAQSLDESGSTPRWLPSLARQRRLRGFCQNSGLSRHGGKLTQKLGPG